MLPGPKMMLGTPCRAELAGIAAIRYAGKLSVESQFSEYPFGYLGHLRVSICFESRIGEHRARLIRHAMTDTRF